MNLTAGFEQLLDSLRGIGKDEARRIKVMKLLRGMEPELYTLGINARDEITGPLVDALYSTANLLRKSLDSGVTFEFDYRSKIAREFVMSAQDCPDHVWEPQTTKLLLKLAEKARLAIVGGAYFGDHAIPMANVMAKPGGTVHCFEANLTQLESLKRNVELNGLDNVACNSTGLWSSDVTIRLEGDDSHARPCVVEDGVSGIRCETVERYCEQRGIDKIDLMMLDIEGGELEALKGAHRFLAGTPGEAPVLVFEIHRTYVDWSNGISNTELVRYLEGCGYRLYAIRDYQGNVNMSDIPIEIVPIERAYLSGPPHGFNVLAVKSDQLIEALELRICFDVSPKLLFHRDPELHQPLVSKD